MVYAVFIDKLKISDYGSIQYVKASEYKAAKSQSKTRHENAGEDRSHSKNKSKKRKELTSEPVVAGTHES